LQQQALAQLVRMFGPAAANPLWTSLQDWAQEPLTAAKDDQHPLAYHPMYDEAQVPSPWAQRLWLAGTERSPNYGGYLEGALEAAELAVKGLLDSVNASAPHAQAASPEVGELL
jgi:monoamine oxidase